MFLTAWREDRPSRTGRALTAPAEARAGYPRLLALGGTRPIDELDAAAGIEVRCDRATVARLADRVVAKMEEDEG